MSLLSAVWETPATQGFCGAFVYAVNVLIFSLYSGWSDRARRYRAIAEFAAALFTGAVFAQGLTEVTHGLVNKVAVVDRVAIALTIGWASNYLWPKVLRKLGNKVDAIPVQGDAK